MQWMQRKTKMDLQVPFTTADGKEVTSLTFHRLVTKEVRLIPDEVFSGEMKNPVVLLPVIAGQVGISEEELNEKLDAVDLIEAGIVLTSFLVKSRPTGGTS